MAGDMPWHELSGVAAMYPLLASELILLLEADAALKTTPNILRFIGEIRPKSRLLRERCLNALRENRQDRSPNRNPIEAAELLAEHFAGDSEVLRELVSLLPNDRWRLNTASGPLVALCNGWPDSSELLSYVDSLQGERVSWETWFALAFLKTPDPEHFLDSLCRFFEGGGIGMAREHQRIVRYCARTLAKYRTVYNELLDCYLHGKDANLFTSAPNLLAATGPISPVGRQVLLIQVERQLSRMHEPIVGFDLGTNQFRSAALGLFDILSRGDV
jgi:hypothetical protein